MSKIYLITISRTGYFNLTNHRKHLLKYFAKIM